MSSIIETQQIVKVDIATYSYNDLQDILKDLDHIFETDSSRATVKFIGLIYNRLMEIREQKKEIIGELQTVMETMETDGETHRVQFPDSEDHFLESSRLWWKSEILENCECALWVLWEMEYEHQRKLEDVPISSEKVAELLETHKNMTQAERIEKRLYIADGLYTETGVEHPCPICGFQVEEEARG